MKNKVVIIALCVTYVPWGCALLLRSFGPVDYGPVGFATLLLVLAFLGSFFLVVAIWRLAPTVYRRNSAESRRNGPLSYPSDRLANMMLLLSLVFLLAIVVDKLVLGQAGEFGITEARYLAIAEGPRGTILGAVHHYLAGAPVLLACVLIAYPVAKLTRMKRAILWAVVLLCFSAFFLSGGRNSFAIGATVVLFFYLLNRACNRGQGPQYEKATVAKRHPAWLLVAAGVGGAYSLYLFAERAAIRGGNLEDAAIRLWWDYGTQVHLPEAAGELMQGVYLVLVFVVYYVTHPLEFISPYLESGYSPMRLGGYSFILVARTIDVVFGTNYFDETLDSLLTPGVYLSLPGSAYIDFGFAGTIAVGILLGILSLTYIRKSLSQRCVSDMFLAALIMAIMAFSPIYSVTGIANGPSILFLVLMVKVISKRYVFGRRTKGSRNWSGVS